jgi:hypothetical protein
MIDSKENPSVNFSRFVLEAMYNISPKFVDWFDFKIVYRVLCLIQHTELFEIRATARGFAINSSDKSPASYRSGLGSFQAQVMWDLWWI